METGRQPQQDPYQNVPYPLSARRLYDPLAILSLICGLLFILPLIAAVAAIVLGWMARRRIAANPEYRGSGMALAGMILGILSIVGLFVSIPMFLEAREKQNRLVCMSNLQQISYATNMYASDSRGRFPPDPSLLNKYIQRPGVWICPECQQPVAGGGGGGVGAASSYIYLGSKLGARMVAVRNPRETILVYEPLSNHKGKGFCAAYVDGHIEWIEKERAQAVMQQINQSIAPATMPKAP